MKRMAAAVALALLVAVPDARASQLARSLFKYECRQANVDKLPFTCRVTVEDGTPFLTFEYSAVPTDEMSEAVYRQRLLVMRFLEAGGVFMEIVDNKSSKRKTCSRIKGRLDISCRPWEPIK